ncbi:MAG: SMC-Scp complex subunit ScpB [Minisyncoccia bacterium]
METHTSDIAKKIEALLFYEGGTITFTYLKKVIKDISDEAMHAAVAELQAVYTERGVSLFLTGEELSLRVSPSCTTFIEEVQSKEFKEDIGPASLETLGILLYRGPSSQVEIDAIRGVNSSFALRHLRMRGLIERSAGTGSQKNLYVITTEALAHLGITTDSALPQAEEIRTEIAQFERRTQHTDAPVDDVDTSQ